MWACSSQAHPCIVESTLGGQTPIVASGAKHAIRRALGQRTSIWTYRVCHAREAQHVARCLVLMTALANASSLFAVQKAITFWKEATFKGLPHLLALLRLVYLYSTQPIVRILENVTTGEIGDITEEILSEEYMWRKIVTEPQEPCMDVLVMFAPSWIHSSYTIE